MIFDAKTAIISAWIALVLAVFLWYRADLYDRILAIYALLVGIGMFIIYGVLSGMDPHQGGVILYLIMWVTVFILAIGVHLLIRSGLTLIYVIIACIVLLIMGLSVFGSDVKLEGPSINTARSAWSTRCHGIPTLINSDGSPFYPGAWWLFLAGVTVPLIFLLSNSGWVDFSLYFLLAFIVATGFMTWAFIPHNRGAITSAWLYAMLIFIFAAWIFGMF